MANPPSTSERRNEVWTKRAFMGTRKRDARPVKGYYQKLWTGEKRWRSLKVDLDVLF
jgi:hypothetical protein